MTMSFSHQTLGQRVCFGAGNLTTDVRGETKRLGAQQILLIASGSAQRAADELHATLRIAHRLDGARQHVPVEEVELACDAATQAEADLILCVGGGSAIGLGKAVALKTRVPILAVPTTYAGSEATNVWGVTEAGAKATGADDVVLPRTVVYDAELVRDLPAELASASGMNALAHCIDSFWAPHADPLNRLAAEEAIRALSRGMAQSAAAPSRSLEASQQLQYGAYLAATAFASAGSGLHHKICHVLGGSFGLPHAQTHAVMLPHVLAFNLGSAPEAGERIAAALGAADPLEGLTGLRAQIGAPHALRDHGLKEADLERAAELILGVVPASNPREMTLEDAAQLIRAAWAGGDPATDLFSHRSQQSLL
ncbi:maleylacetate reductase [Nesterenkonia sp. E16_7]|uniref:maleylacetate reductase n=2 Tax=unclassified Nesterenkonia TaxID=2629769 RepID=UPI001A92C465|nr:MULTISPECIES: maleylacetate reductase [unclassified Nesterenkonia]MBO0596677.1 maleylacetate reductase [Nesterenkonia sp. E16_10]MBO0597929.1 maleylacetate reductase [Nesterenkonia sp. E16_7]